MSPLSPEIRSRCVGSPPKDIVITQDFFPTIGGAHLWLYEVYKRWPSPVTILAQDYRRDPELALQQRRFDCLPHGSATILRKDLYINEISLFDLRCLFKYATVLHSLRSIVNDHQLNLHCIRAFPEGIAAAAYKMIFRRLCRLVVYAHGEELLVAKTSRQLRSLTRWTYASADLIIANSRSTEQLVLDLCPGARVCVIHPGVDMAAFQISDQERKACRLRWNWPEETVVLVTMARLEPRKNHAAVIEVMAELRGQGFPLAYVIGSDGEERANLASRIHRLGLTPWVKMTGYLTDEERICTLAAADIHVMPSVKAGPMIEGFGIVFLEAAAVGIPSIAGNTGGQIEAVQHWQTGLVVDGSNAVRLREAIITLVQNKILRDQLGANGKLWARENDWRNISRKSHGKIQEISRYEGA